MILFLTGFLSQILFAIFRTINVQYVSKDNLGGSLWSGTVVAILWVVTTKIGLTAFEDTIYGFLGYLIGAASGIALAMRYKLLTDWIRGKRTGVYYAVDKKKSRHIVTIGNRMYEYPQTYCSKPGAIQMARDEHKLFTAACYDAVNN